MVYVCPYCKKEYRTVSKLKRHVKENHIEDFCPVCGKKVDVFKHVTKINDLDHLLLYFLVENLATSKSLRRKFKEKNLTKKDLIMMVRK